MAMLLICRVTLAELPLAAPRCLVEVQLPAACREESPAVALLLCEAVPVGAVALLVGAFDLLLDHRFRDDFLGGINLLGDLLGDFGLSTRKSS